MEPILWRHCNSALSKFLELMALLSQSAKTQKSPREAGFQRPTKQQGSANQSIQRDVHSADERHIAEENHRNRERDVKHVGQRKVSSRMLGDVPFSRLHVHLIFLPA